MAEISRRTLALGTAAAAAAARQCPRDLGRQKDVGDL